MNDPTTRPEPDRCPVITRRRFLAALGASVAGVAVAGYGISVWGRHPTAPITNPTATPTPAPGAFGSTTGRTLVVVEMGGGNDGLNTVVPHADPRYHDLRGDLAITEPLPLDDEIGLHPALGFLADEYAAGRLAIVEGVGYPDPDLSHFASMATWWAGAPGATATTGWLGRYLDGTVGGDVPLAAVSIGPGPTPALLGDRIFQVSIRDLSGLAPHLPPWIDSTDELFGMWQGFAPAIEDPGTLLGRVRGAITATIDAAAALDEVLPDGGPSTPERRRGRSDLETSMAVAAALVVGPEPPAVVYVHGWGDFDTHEGQAARHEELMTSLDSALAGFFATVSEAGAADRVVVMTTSEFGRRAASNGSGTDHGTASVQFLLGAPVAGGRYGEAPSLTDLDRRGNPVHTVDYRSVYASVLTGWFEADAESILGGDFEVLPVIG